MWSRTSRSGHGDESVLGIASAESLRFVIGSVAPDIDALTRCGGNLAFLKHHQGWTHGPAVHLLLGVAVASFLLITGDAFFLPALACFTLGATIPSLLDLNNTYGVRVLARLSRNWPPAATPARGTPSAPRSAI